MFSANSLVKAVALILLAVLFRFLARKFLQRTEKWVRITATAGACLVAFAVAVLPLENVVPSFDSPEKAYSYYGDFGTDAWVVVEGEESAFVMGYNGETTFFPHIFSKQGEIYSGASSLRFRSSSTHMQHMQSIQS